MVLDVDGFAVFRCIGSHQATFEGIAGDVNKASRTLISKLITSKNTGLKALRDIRSALGSEVFCLIADGLSNAHIKTMVARLDKNNVEMKIAGAPLQRQHFFGLTDGSQEPMEKPAPRPKQERVKKSRAAPKAPERIFFSSAGATRKR
jgi:hypothetical protein